MTRFEPLSDEIFRRLDSGGIHYPVATRLIAFEAAIVFQKDVKMNNQKPETFQEWLMMIPTHCKRDEKVSFPLQHINEEIPTLMPSCFWLMVAYIAMRRGVSLEDALLSIFEAGGSDDFGDNLVEEYSRAQDDDYWVVQNVRHSFAVPLKVKPADAILEPLLLQHAFSLKAHERNALAVVYERWANQLHRSAALMLLKSGKRWEPVIDLGDHTSANN
ncbi:MAG TPA: hypothetical protein VGO67_23490 [Verrucomicrobiae bacterium]|jgi:hypothetical protein